MLLSKKIVLPLMMMLGCFSDARNQKSSSNTETEDASSLPFDSEFQDASKGGQGILLTEAPLHLEYKDITFSYCYKRGSVPSSSTSSPTPNRTLCQFKLFKFYTCLRANDIMNRSELRDGSNAAISYNNSLEKNLNGYGLAFANNVWTGNIGSYKYIYTPVELDRITLTPCEPVGPETVGPESMVGTESTRVH
jgi:hypothetical protein